MVIIEGNNIDLISPFPIGQAKRVYGWMHCNRSLVETDLSPKNPEDFETYMVGQLQSPLVISFGIIDKLNQLKIDHPAPLIGMLFFEYAGPFNGYFHIATSRKAWGTGFADEALKLAIDAVFRNDPTLLRVSGAVLDHNHAVKSLARRVGFRFEGVMQDCVLQNGRPKAIAHFGLTRKEFGNLCLLQQQSLSHLDSEEQPSEHSEEVESKEVEAPAEALTTLPQ